MSRQTGRTTLYGGNVDMATALGVQMRGAHVTDRRGCLPNGSNLSSCSEHSRARGQFPGLDFPTCDPTSPRVAHPGTFSKGVEPSGSLLSFKTTRRRQLRVIDIKLTAEPSAYFTEVVLYSMALAGWLEDEGLDEQFVVAADAALWPGSHDASALRQVAQDIRDAGERRHRSSSSGSRRRTRSRALQFFSEGQSVLRTRSSDSLSRPWRDLDWHVDNHLGMPFLGALRG